MKKNEKEARVPSARADGPQSPTKQLAVRSGVRAGRLGNKVWSDDWLAPV